MTGDMEYQGTSGYLDSWCKRCFDVVVCLLLLPLALIVTGGAALWILVKEGRPVLFVQSRVGRRGELFRMPKLRTLRADACPCTPPTEYDLASYVTPTGAFLRRYKLDEMPQFLTVLAGRMSLVGPRPELPAVVMAYTSFQRRRLLAKPGITGLWQVMADPRVPIHRNLKYDLYYLRKASLWLDIRLLALTVPALLGRDRGHHP